MKIALVIPKGNLGGAQRYVYSLATSLRDRGHVLTVIHGEGEILGNALRDAGAIRVIGYEKYSNRSISADIRVAYLLWKMLRSKEIDIAAFNSSKSLLVLWLLSFTTFRRELLLTVHGFPWFPDDRSTKRRLKQFIFGRLASRAQHIIAVSNFVRGQLNETRHPQQRVTVIHNTVALDHATKLMRTGGADSDQSVLGAELYRIGERDILAYHVARPLRAVSLAELVANKGIVPMCLALARHRRRLEGRLTWHIYGEGPQRGEIESLLRVHQLEQIVKLRGFADDASERIRDYDLMLIPSRNEAFGMVALEAAASGVHVVANDVGGLREAVPSEKHGTLLEGHLEIANFICGLADEGLCPLVPQDISLESLQKRHSDWVDKHEKFIAGISSS